MKLTNGSIVPLNALLTDGAQDDNNKPLKFEQLKGSGLVSYSAKGSDGRIYGFSLETTNVRVLVTQPLPAPAPRQQQQSKPAPAPTTTTVRMTTSPSSPSSSPSSKHSSPPSSSTRRS